MWLYIIAWIVAAVAVFLLMPKPETQKPEAVDEIDMPVAKDGKEIPVLFGTRDISGPNVVWYGNIRTKEHKVSGGKK